MRPAYCILPENCGHFFNQEWCALINPLDGWLRRKFWAYFDHALWRRARA